MTYIVREMKANIDCCDKFNRTALHWAVRTNNLQVVIKLLELRISDNVEDLEGHTAMDLAKKLDFLPIVDILKTGV